jgi:hypothetical protein
VKGRPPLMGRSVAKAGHAHARHPGWRMQTVRALGRWPPQFKRGVYSDEIAPRVSRSFRSIV